MTSGSDDGAATRGDAEPLALLAGGAQDAKKMEV